MQFMLEGYFLDMYLCLCEVVRVCRKGAKAAFVVGNTQYDGMAILADRVHGERSGSTYYHLQGNTSSTVAWQIVRSRWESLDGWRPERASSCLRNEFVVGPVVRCGMTDKLINKDPEILGGTPVFSGTRVPIRILIEYLEAGDRLDDFLESYPTVSRNQAIEVLERAKAVLTRKITVHPRRR